MAKTETRLYLVTENGGNEKIVEATSQAQAIRLVVGERFKATPASAKDVARIYMVDMQKRVGGGA